MGKFPGKSYKTVYRRRTNVVVSQSVAYPENESMQAAKNICIGLAVFNDVFGSDEKVGFDFRGFTTEDALAAIQCTRHEQQVINDQLTETGSEAIALSDSFEDAITQFDLHNIEPTSPQKITRAGRKLKPPRHLSIDTDSSVDDNSHLSCKSKLLSQPVGETTTLKKFAAKKLLQKAKNVAAKPPTVSQTLQEKGCSNMSRKFVLPSRSAHSSRVIKPSKRVMESEEVISKTSTGTNQTQNASHIELKKPKLILPSASKPPELIFSDSYLKSKSTTGKINERESGYPFKSPEELTSNFSDYCERTDNALLNTSEDGALIVEGKRRWKPTYKVQLKLRELNVFGAGTSKFSSKRTLGSRSSSSRSESHQTSSSQSTSSLSSESNQNDEINGESEDSSSNSQWPSPNASILRKPRLKLNTKSYPGNEGSFSAGFSASQITRGKGNCPNPGIVECGVCGAVRFYKFVNQAKKFGVNCCESCRKFIAKMVNRQQEKPLILECHGEGTCKSVPIVRSRQWKSGHEENRCMYKARCPACWLKLCLRCFIMPEELVDKLYKLLPVSMREGSKRVLTSDPVKVQEGEDAVDSKCKQLSLSVCSSIPKDSMPFNSKVTTSKRKRKATVKYLPEEDVKQIIKPKEIPLKQKILKKASIKLVKSSIKHATKKKKDQKKRKRGVRGSNRNRRQKVDLKGPRVKHVCRSASVVLGQVQATFPSTEKVSAKTLPDLASSTKILSKSGSYCQGCDNSNKVHECTRKVCSADADRKKQALAADVLKAAVEVSVAEEVPSNPTVRKPNKLPPPPLVRALQLPGKLPSVEQKSLVSIDFWESYDPEEVCNTGFGLIGSEEFHTRAMCFLCGSAGHEKRNSENYCKQVRVSSQLTVVCQQAYLLIHCASCCEPYHRFCLYDGLRDPTMSLKNSKDEWRLDWVCQRCKVCHTCGVTSGQQLSCQRCRRTYHTECLGNGISRLHSPDRPWVCSACLRCNSCGIPNVTQFVGNLPFCNTCFKLRKKGNYCPLCQKCYEDDDYDSKMMECGRCKCWVHAKCEGLSDEKYQVLSFLPESVEFICRNCFAMAPWRLSVDEAMKSGYMAVIKAFSKNRKARSLLKYSPKKKCSCQPTVLRKRLPFPDLDNSETKEDVICDVPNEERIPEETDLMRLPVLEKEALTCVIKEEVPEFKTELIVNDELQSQPKVIEPNKECPNKLLTLDKSLKEKFKLKDCTVRVGKLENPLKELIIEEGVESLDSTFSDSSTGKSPPKLNLLAVTPSDSGIGSTDDELKVNSDEVVIEPVRVYAPSTEMGYSSGTNEDLISDDCRCVESFMSQPTLLSIKKKVDNNEYFSLLQFNQEMERLLSLAESDAEELMTAYYRSLKDLFPWFDPKHDQVSTCSRPREEHPDEDVANLQEDWQVENIPELIVPEWALGRDLEYYYGGHKIVDERSCVLCKGLGDGLPVDEGRLLYCGQNEWTHANCALWSSEVFEEIDGSLQNVHSAIFRGKKISCESCGKKGASIGCCSRNCFNTYHFPCARLNSTVFMEDKNVFCPLHATEAGEKVISHIDEFDLRRPIYVELDRKKKKYVEPNQVRFMIGSLYVQNLGMFVSGVSDTFDAIIPTDFDCTRLFWSTLEPWRIVQYNMKTILPKIKTEPAVDHLRNITINHEDDESIVQHQLDEVSLWHRQLVSGEVKTYVDAKNKLLLQTVDGKVVQEVMDYILDTVTSKEIEENTADLLPQELKDAIFDDLPHDLLDGISMEDILDPKLMNYEDFSTMDLKDSCYNSDVDDNKEVKEIMSEDAILNAEVEENTKNQNDDGNMTDSDLWFGGSKEHFNDSTEDNVGNVPDNVAVKIRELKRSKSEVILEPIKKTAGTRSQQRSCSLTWSCTVDHSKRRKIQSRGTRSAVDGLISIDVTADSHKIHDLRLPDGVLATLARSTATSVITSTVSEVDDLKDTPSNHTRHRVVHQEEEGKENKCLSWHGRPRLLQVDGAVDSSSSSSEGGSPLPPDIEEEPVKCSRCHRTYRTRISFERHLPTCTSEFILSTSESDSETRSSEGDNAKKLSEDVTNQSMLHPINIQNNNMKFVPQDQYEIDVNEVIIKTESEQNEGDKQVGIYIQLDQQMPMANLQQSNSNHPECTASSSVVNETPSQMHSTVVVTEPYMPRVLQSQNKPKTYSRLPGQGRPRGRPPKVRPTHDLQQFKMQTSNVICNNGMTVMNQSMMSQSQQSIMSQTQQSMQPHVIVQQVPSANMMPAFLDSFQQQTGHNLQYLATIDVHANSYNKPQYLANGIVPGTFQLQSSPDSYVGIQNGSVVLPNVQLGSSQPTVLGTLIQQPTTAIQCGMMGQEQMVLNTAPLEMFHDQSGGMFLSSPQMYYGLETIVSNTVMSSSQVMSSNQFLPGMQGMVAASSSYSATTTQVYQTNKIEPIMDVPAGYVIVPNSQLTNQRVNQNISQNVNQNMSPNINQNIGQNVNQNMSQNVNQNMGPNVNHAMNQTLNQNMNQCSNQHPIGLPSHMPTQTVTSQPQTTVPNAWTFNNVDTFIPSRDNQQQVLIQKQIQKHIPVQKPRPCYMPKPPVVRPYIRPPSQTANNANLPKNFSQTGQSSFKSTKVCNQNPVNVNTNRTLKPVVPPLMKVLPKPAVSATFDSDNRQQIADGNKSAVDTENRPIQPATVPSPTIQNNNNNMKSQSPIKLILQKSVKNGYYKITHQVIPNIIVNSNKKESSQGQESKLQIVKLCSSQNVDKSPLANKTEPNRTNKPAKKRWFPKEKVKPLQKTVPPSNLIYQVHSQDGFSCTSTSVAEVWEKVFEAVQKARIHHKMSPLTRNPFGINIAGLQMLGLSHNGLRYLTEQLPGVNRCINYTPRYHKLVRPTDEDDVDTVPIENPTGCCRSEPFRSRSQYDLFSWLASRHRKAPKLATPSDESITGSNRRATSSNLPMAMRYRHLKETSKEAVGVYRSHIHGRGLFCLRDIESGEMVVEYAGEVIRSTLTDYREKLYDRKDIGCYMFRIDDQLVVDATMRGNAARFINHSCEPNCYSKVVDILGKKHILIFALRRIPQGEELTYDYKFPFEDVKIPCTCGSRRCRKHLN